MENLWDCLSCTGVQPIWGCKTSRESRGGNEFDSSYESDYRESKIESVQAFKLYAMEVDITWPCWNWTRNITPPSDLVQHMILLADQVGDVGLALTSLRLRDDEITIEEEAGVTVELLLDQQSDLFRKPRHT